MGKQLNAFPPRSGTRQQYPGLPVLFDIILEILASERNGKKQHTLWKKTKTVPIYR